MSKRDEKELTRYMNAPLTDDERARAGLDMPDMVEDKIRKIADRLRSTEAYDIDEAERILREELEGLMVAAAAITRLSLAKGHKGDESKICEECRLIRAVKEYGWPWRKS